MRGSDRLPEMPEERKPEKPPWVRLSGLGIELTAAVVGFTLAGYWWDRHYGTGPWGVVTGVALGMIGGMYNLIRRSLLATRSDTKKKNGDRER